MVLLEEIDEDPAKSRQYGINHESVLLELDHFDMCKGELSSNCLTGACSF